MRLTCIFRNNLLHVWFTTYDFFSELNAYLYQQKPLAAGTLLVLGINAAKEREN